VKAISKAAIWCAAGLVCASGCIKGQDRANFGVPEASDRAVSTSGSTEKTSASTFSSDVNLAAQDGSASPARSASSKPARAEKGREIGKVGIGVKISTLGVGFEAGVSIASRLNVRGGFNAFSYGRTFNYNGITYKGNLDFKNADLLLDWFPFRKGFHLSGGALIYNGNNVNATASAPAGQTLTLGSNTYYSGNTNPLSGTGNLNFRKVAPMALLGFGNLVPRTRHFSFGVDAGVAFVGIPQTKLALQGTACTDMAQTNCLNAATNPMVQSDILAQQKILNNKARYAQYWPILSMGFGYRF
jgi:hypothetical protein